jgi:hypothetical protein
MQSNPQSKPPPLRPFAWLVRELLARNDGSQTFDEAIDEVMRLYVKTHKRPKRRVIDDAEISSRRNTWYVYVQLHFQFELPADYSANRRRGESPGDSQERFALDHHLSPCEFRAWMRRKGGIERGSSTDTSARRALLEEIDRLRIVEITGGRKSPFLITAPSKLLSKA